MTITLLNILDGFINANLLTKSLILDVENLFKPAKVKNNKFQLLTSLTTQIITFTANIEGK